MSDDGPVTTAALDALEQRGRLGELVTRLERIGPAWHPRLARVALRVRELGAVRAELEQALALARDDRDAPREAALLGVLGRLYALHGSGRTGAELGARALAAAAASGDPRWRWEALADLAATYLAEGRADVAGPLIAEASELAPGRWERLRTRALEVGLALARADAHAGRELAASLLLEARQASDAVVTADAMTLLGRALVDLRDYPAARKVHRAAMDAHRAIGDRGGVAASLGGLGLCAMGQDQHAEAATLLQRAVTLLAELGHAPAEAAWRVHLDRVAVLLDRTEWRIRLLQDQLALARRLGDRGLEASLLCELGNCHREIKRPDLAIPWYEQALAVSRALDDAEAVVVDALNLALARAEAADPGAAAAIDAALAAEGGPAALREAARRAREALGA